MGILIRIHLIIFHLIILILTPIITPTTMATPTPMTTPTPMITPMATSWTMNIITAITHILTMSCNPSYQKVPPDT
jgi:hypothetical protein